MRGAALALAVIAVSLFVYSLSMEPYKTDFWGGEVAYGDGKAYYQARQSALTAKFALEDYAGTVAIAALVLFVYSFRSMRISPKSIWTYALLSIMAPVVLCAAFVFDLGLSYERREFPLWADSLAIPLLGVPVFLLISFCWVCAHLMYIHKTSVFGTSFSLSTLRSGGYWLPIVSAITLVLIGLMMAVGDWWFAFSGFIWLHFYLSLSVAKEDNDV